VLREVDGGLDTLDFPLPAGADTIVSLRAVERSSRSINAERSTTGGRTRALFSSDCWSKPGSLGISFIAIEVSLRSTSYSGATVTKRKGRSRSACSDVQLPERQRGTGAVATLLRANVVAERVREVP
jgi:hypothetical protein